MRTLRLLALPVSLAVAATLATPASAATVAAPASVTAAPRPAAIAVSFVPAPGVTTYELNCVSSTGASASLTVTATSSPFEALITNLVGNTAHACKIRGVIGADSSAWVNATPGIVVPTPLAKPAAPASLTAEPQVAAVKLRFATVAGADLYALRCAPVGKAPTAQDTILKQPVTAPGVPFLPSPLEAVIADLAAGPHTCQVTASNNAGTSAPKLTPAFTPLVSKLPAPGSVVALPGDSSITVSFATVPGATSYTVACTSKTAKTVTIVDQKLSPVFVPGLVNGANYRCSVYAERSTVSVGTVVKEISVWASAPEVVPAPQKNVSPGVPTVRSLTGSADFATRSGKITAAVGFDQAAGTPSSYTLRCTGVTDPSFVGTVSGITPLVLTAPVEKSYTCTVTASNTFGTSAPSVPAAVSVPAVKSTPDALAFTAKRNKDHSSTVAFRVTPFTNATGYRITCESGGKSLWVPSSTTAATLKLPLGRWECTVAAQVDKEMTAESPVTVVNVAPAKPKFTRSSNAVKFFRPTGWTGRWLASCRGDVGSVSRSGSSADITLLLPRGTFDCKVFIGGIGSEAAVVKI
jgi:hypothetical protein